MSSSDIRPHYSIEERKRWMAILARCSAEQLRAHFRELDPKPRFDLIDPVEPALTPVQGDTVRSFPMARPVTRCVVRLSSGVTGTACLPGRKRRHAVMAAVFDALLKEPERYDELIGTVVESMAYDVSRSVTRRGRDA